jgi:hypothetical protein
LVLRAGSPSPSSLWGRACELQVRGPSSPSSLCRIAVAPRRASSDGEGMTRWSCSAELACGQRWWRSRARPHLAPTRPGSSSPALATAVAGVELPTHLLVASVAGVEVPRAYARGGGGAGGTSEVTGAASIDGCGAVFSADAAMDSPVASSCCLAYADRGGHRVGNEWEGEEKERK